MVGDKPNILIVFIDSLRADHAGCYGYKRPTTPYLDRLATEGCLFETCITAAPFSPASYASVFSNLYPHQHGVNGDTIRMWPDHWKRLPERMKEHGYFTFGVSNNSFVSAEMNSTRGFDSFVGPRTPWLTRQFGRVYRNVTRVAGEHIADLFDSHRILAESKGDSMSAIRRAADFANQAADRPFFGLVILMDPHALYHPARTHFVRDRAAARSFLKRINGRQMWAKVMAGVKTLSDADLQTAFDFYDGETHHADQALGTLVDSLQRRNLLDNTLLVVAADHGESFGEQGVWGHGFTLTDCQTRVPLILRHPGYFPAGSRSNALVQLHDVHDTFLSLAADGRPCVGEHPHCLTQAVDPHWPGRDAAFSEFPVQTGTLAFMSRLNPTADWGNWARPMWSVRTPKWRYIQYDGGGEELFDLHCDPGERTSVHECHAEVCNELHRRLAAHRTDSVSSVERAAVEEPAINAAVLDRLRALGYMDNAT